MSDYFGALMRSSGLKVGARPSASARGDGQRPAQAHDIVEIDLTREADGTDVEVAGRHSRSVESAAIERERPAIREPARAGSETPEPHDPVRVNREAVDVERLQRAVLDAALRWVTSDPLAPRPGHVGPSSDTRAAANESQPLPERSAATRADTSAAAASSPGAIFVRTGDDVSMAEIDFETPQSRSSRERTASSAPEGRSSTPVEEVVEVSIGSIHVHVDGPKAKPANPKPALTRSGDGRERSSGSGLQRRYLRAI